MNKEKIVFIIFIQILEAAAETEEAWHGCGQRPGLEIWRIVVSMRACLYACMEWTRHVLIGRTEVRDYLWCTANLDWPDFEWEDFVFKIPVYPILRFGPEYPPPPENRNLVSTWHFESFDYPRNPSPSPKIEI